MDHDLNGGMNDGLTAPVTSLALSSLPKATLVIDAPDARDEIRQLIAGTGCSTTRILSVAEAMADPGAWSSSDAVIVHLSHSGESTTQLIKFLNQGGASQYFRLVMIVPRFMIDEIFGMLDRVPAAYLVDANTADAVSILRQAVQPRQSHVAEGEGEGDHIGAELFQLTREIEAIAQRLAKISRSQGSGGDTAMSQADSPAIPLRVESSYKDDGIDNIAAQVSAEDVRRFMEMRTLRSQFFDGALFADPAWDILLDLYASLLDGQAISVSSLCIAANVPPTTALRWINLMTEKALLERRADEQDGRRKFIGLSDEAAQAMHHYFTALIAKGLWGSR